MKDITVNIGDINKNNTSQIFYSMGKSQAWRKRVVEKVKDFLRKGGSISLSKRKW